MNNRDARPTRERRAHRRYPIALAVEYFLTDRRGSTRPGRGRTIDLSSGGALIEPDQPIPAGAFNVDLTLCWPATQNGTSLKLVAHGRIVRRTPRGAISVAFWRYKLKATPAQCATPAPGVLLQVC